MPEPLNLLQELAQIPDPRSRRGGAGRCVETAGVGAVARGVENGSHYRRDGTLGEDPSRVRKGCAPEILAGLRNSIIHLVKDVAPSLATAIRRLGNCFSQALDLLGLPQL